MIIEVPIVYDLEVFMPRTRKPRSVHITSVHPVEIKEEPNAILVAEINAEGWFKREDGTYPQHKVYMIDGEFWATTFKDDRGDEADIIVTTDLYEKAVNEQSYIPEITVLGNKPQSWSVSVFPSEKDVGARSIASSNKEAVITDIEKKAQDLRIADGMILRRASEPVYQFTWFYGNDPYLRQRFVHRVLQGQSMSDDQRFLWGLNEFDQMLAQIRETHGNANGVLDELSAATVYRPDLLTWSHWQANVITSYNRAVKSYEDRHAFATDNIDQFSAFIALRDNGLLAENASEEEISHAMQLAMELRRTNGLAPDDDGIFSDALHQYQEMQANSRNQSFIMETIRNI